MGQLIAILRSNAGSWHRVTFYETIKISNSTISVSGGNYGWATSALFQDDGSTTLTNVTIYAGVQGDFGTQETYVGFYNFRGSLVITNQ
jgi:hypothetical protein